MKEYFYRYPREERKKVKGIVIDMYPPYMELIRQLFPNAEIILDAFHLIQALGRELDRYRIMYMNEIRYQDHRLYNKYKRYWRLILQCPIQLTRVTYDRFPLFDFLTNTGRIVDYLVNQNDTLKSTYQIVHSLSQAIRDRHYNRIEALLEQSTLYPLSKGLRRVIRTFKKYHEMIKQTCLHPNISNGPIEDINNKIKVLKRTAYGYRNFWHFRNRILLISRLYVSGKKEKVINTLFAA